MAFFIYIQTYVSTEERAKPSSNILVSEAVLPSFADKPSKILSFT